MTQDESEQSAERFREEFLDQQIGEFAALVDQLNRDPSNLRAFGESLRQMCMLVTCHQQQFQQLMAESPELAAVMKQVLELLTDPEVAAALKKLLEGE